MHLSFKRDRDFTETLVDSEGFFDVLDVTQPDLLLLDIHLPKHDGWTFWNITTHNVGNTKMRVVIISSEGKVEDNAQLIL